MSNNSNGLVPSEGSTPLNVPNMEVDKDKLDRPYVKVKNENGDWFKQTKMKNGKTKREMVSDK